MVWVVGEFRSGRSRRRRGSSYWRFLGDEDDTLKSDSKLDF